MTDYSQRIKDLADTLYPKEDLSDRIRSARQYVERNHAKDLDLDHICKQACISKYYFIRLFKSFYGQTPHQYLRELRVARAKHLIQDGITVQEACFKVGYESVTSFSSLFRKLTGIAPSRLKNSNNR